MQDLVTTLIAVMERAAPGSVYLAVDDLPVIQRDFFQGNLRRLGRADAAEFGSDRRSRLWCFWTGDEFVIGTTAVPVERKCHRIIDGKLFLRERQDQERIGSKGRRFQHFVTATRRFWSMADLGAQPRATRSVFGQFPRNFCRTQLSQLSFVVRGSTCIARRFVDADHGAGISGLSVDFFAGLSGHRRLCRRCPILDLYALWRSRSRPGPAPDDSAHNTNCVDAFCVYSCGVDLYGSGAGVANCGACLWGRCRKCLRCSRGIVFVRELVDKEAMSNAIALNASMFQLATVVGPAVAGVTYALVGPALCFAINGVSYVAVIVALALMKIPRELTTRTLNSGMNALREGLHYVGANTLIRTFILIAVVISLFGTGYVALMPAWAVNVLGGDATTNGLLQSVRVSARSSEH